MLRGALVVGLFLGLAAAARAQTCSTTITGGTYTDLLVPAGDTCTLQGVRVTGNIVVQSGATLIAESNCETQSSVGGNVIATGAACLYLVSPGVSVGGNVIAIGTVAPVTSSQCTSERNNVFCPTKVTGNAAILGSSSNSLPWNFCSVSFTVGGNFEFANNATEGYVVSKTIRGNLLFDNNTDGGFISDNTIGGNLQCSGNSPAPTGSGNTVSGAKLGQCSTF
jgi:hypothetical protein